MRFASRAALLVVFFAIFAGCSSAPAPGHGASRGSDAELGLLARYLTGSFSSAAQAEGDPAYFDIRLHMQPIWPDRKDGRWLYVEQAVAGQEHRPYRQRVYRLTARPPEGFESAVFTLPAEERFIGAWRSPPFFERISPDSLTPRSGCSIYLTRVDEGTFRGATGDRTCPSELRGASYATSEVTITAGALVSWDRGFDAEGAQVWGATGGGYVFLRTDD